ncbi:MAG: class I SAM-dependent methyltransferase [Flavobacteriales bacterium]|nr:class I SAM-dependent methyltransferase [Flavobacteriales bacterium]
MKKLKTCSICNEGSFTVLFSCKDYSTSKENFTIVSCSKCNFTFTNPRPTDENLGKYYVSEKYISHTNTSKGLFERLYQIVRKYAILQKLKLVQKHSKSKNHLDIGCGTGEFLNACKNIGFKTRGIEPSEIARLQAINNYNLEVSENTDLNQFNDNSFETITMWHVLEHVPNLNETIEQFSRILEKNGTVIIAVPNLKSWDANYYKEYWAAWDVPIHLWHFSKNSIRSLFKKHGFNLVKVKPMIFDSFYVSVLSEEYKSGRKKLLKGFTIGLISNIIAFFSKRGHSSSIYVFKKVNSLK